MQQAPIIGPIPGTVLTALLAVSSGIFGFIEHADVILSIVAKLVAIAAGISSIVLAYQTYKNHNKK